MTDAIDTSPEVYAEHEERVQRWRLARALTEAPDLLAHVRGIAISGRTERGETLAEWSAPMRITAADDSDAAYAHLVDWVMGIAEALAIAPPATAVAAWRLRTGEVHGFRPATTPEGAALLTSLLTVWLLIHADQIQAWPDRDRYDAYRDNVLDMLGALRARYPLEAWRSRPTYPRPCPECGEYAVTADWHTDDMRAVTISCAICGHAIDTSTGIPTDWLDWLDWAPQETRDCTCRYPGDPTGTCPTHHPDKKDHQ